MDLQVGDRLAAESGEWEVIGRPYTTAAGKNAHVRVKGVGAAVTMIRVGAARERIVVRRGWVRPDLCPQAVNNEACHKVTSEKRPA